MTDRTAVILAHGEQTRLSLIGTPKQLLPLSNGTIFSRTVSMLRSECGFSRIVTVAPASDRWRIACSEAGTEHMSLGSPGSCVLDGLSQVSPSVPICTYVLGDVVFSKAAIRELSKFDVSPLDQKICALGRVRKNPATGRNWRETFAIRIPSCRVNDYLVCCQTFKGNPNGKISSSMIDILVEVPEDDWTDDIDTPADLAECLPILSDLAAREL